MSELKKLLQAMNEGDRCFQINEGSPAENGMLFCYHCGRRLLVHQWEDAEDGECALECSQREGMMLRNLLAVIHGDGGQHAKAMGIEQVRLIAELELKRCSK